MNEENAEACFRALAAQGSRAQGLAILEALDSKDFAIEKFRDGVLSLACAAEVADMPLADFIEYVSRLGIPVINQTAEEVQEDMNTLEQWLKP